MKLFFTSFILLFVFVAEAFTPVKSSLLMDAKTGKFIYGFNENVQAHPASLTKMMTLLLTFKALEKKKIRLDSKIKISKNAVKQRPCKLGVKEGEFITVKNAILALVTKSANDIAVALAEFVGGNENTFVYMMNKEARRLGMTSTRFMNPSGWRNPKQVSTAKDLGKLARALIKEHPKYYNFFATKQFSYNRASMKNHNNLLGTHGDIVIDGIKTGYVSTSGYNLAASATQGKNRLIAVVLGGNTAKQRDKEVYLLFKNGFKRLKNTKSASLSKTISKKCLKKNLAQNLRENKIVQ